LHIKHLTRPVRHSFSVPFRARWRTLKRSVAAPIISPMGMRPTDKDLEQESRAARRQHDAAQRALCVDAVVAWNRLMERRRKPPWSPSLGVVLAAEFYFLDVWCEGCRQLKQVDLRTLDRHPQTTLYGLIPKLSCTSCRPSPPPARLIKVSEHEWASPNAPFATLRRGGYWR
jgi:hypothetical protein